MKNRYLTLKFILNTVCVNLTGLFIVITLDIIKYSTISDKFAPLRYYKDFFIGFTPPVLFLVGLAVFIYVLPISGGLQYLDSNIVSEKVNVAKKRIIGLPKFILILHFIVYFIGFFIDNYPKVIAGNMTLIELGSYFFFAMASAGIYSFIQISINNLILSDIRDSFNITSMDYNKKTKEMNLRLKSFLLVLFSVLYVSCYFITSLVTVLRSESVYITAMEKSIEIDQGREHVLQKYREIMKFQDKGISITVENKAPIDRMKSYVVFFAIIIVLLLIVVLFASFIYSREFTNQLKRQKKTIEGILTGESHINERINIVYNDEVGTLSDRINSLLDKFKSILENISTSSSTITGAASDLNINISTATAFANQMSSASKLIYTDSERQLEAVENTRNELNSINQVIDEINDHTINQTSFIEETSCAMEEMAGSIETVSNTTIEAKTLANNLTEVAASGGKVVYESLDAIKEIEESSTEVKAITELLSSIASQTNLLAMNAAIEAAHAGDAGKGFAVVADEVRKLAEISAESSNDIINHINTMSQRVERGVQLSEQAGKAFEQIDKNVKGTSRLMNEISSAMMEQSSGTEEILSSVHSVVSSAEEVKDLVNDLKKKSQVISLAIKELEEQSSHIKLATSEQDSASSENMNLFKNIQKISDKNNSVAKELKEFIEEFQYT